MVNASIHKAAFVDQVVDPLRDRFAISQRQKVRHIDLGVLSFGLPFSPVVLKIATQFFLLAVNRDERSASLFKLLARVVDRGKLGIPIRMRFPLDRLRGFHVTRSLVRGAPPPGQTS
jgi:hypothetical protein